MTRPLWVLLSISTVAAISVHASAPTASQRHPDFSGSYTLRPDRNVAVNRPPDKWAAPDLTSGRAVAGSCGTEFVITQTATQMTIRVVSGPTAARQYDLPAIDGTYALDRSTTKSYRGRSKKVASVSWRGDALDLVLTQYRSETPAGRVEYLFRFDKDDTLTV